ncbi:STAS domain-containing protein [Amycolatopsis sp. SID8362]|uniref:STAS domain-containing protein n=1 Tax=Amycolatopsis sp. SID8362 TaxID=2690346 RepID=UPI001367DAF8|nr:STAS domain-containing protein [Amycolatopsis sp. SID8362]NBH03240.1 STAS domain-containing protein [Amycolatopsis sp. SID8362]NED39941.1 STAS domain-containing protein [Amycolatopsis sp. SID8362]
MAERDVTGDALGDAVGPAGSVVLEDRAGVAVLRVEGALDLALAPKLRQLAERATRSRPALLVIDLTDVTFLASAGMAELVRAHRGQTAAAPLRVVASGRITLRPLELTRLTDELAIYPSLSEALAR